jgi:ABC-type bacteriocin/lantibiotic exporter with double-glycine peptidase domain
VAQNLLALHKQQIADGYCLPACAEMALAYWGISNSQQKISRTLKLRPGLGVPAPNITLLRSPQIDVEYFVGSSFDSILQWLQNAIPVIAFVQAGELPHWRGARSQHAVLVVGFEDQELFIHDPGLDYGSVAISLDDFLLAWDEMDARCAIIIRRFRNS